MDKPQEDYFTLYRYLHDASAKELWEDRDKAQACLDTLWRRLRALEASDFRHRRLLTNIRIGADAIKSVLET